MACSSGKIWPTQRAGVRRAQGKVRIAKKPEEAIVARRLGGVGGEGLEGRAKRILRLFDRLEISRREEREDHRTERSDVALRHQHRLAQDVGVDLVELRILLRNASAVDDAVDRRAVLLHALEDDAGVQRGALDRGVQLVGSGVVQVPAEGDAAQRGVHQHGAVAIIPGKPEQAGLPRAIFGERLAPLARNEDCGGNDIPGRCPSLGERLGLRPE